MLKPWSAIGRWLLPQTTPESVYFRNWPCQCHDPRRRRRNCSMLAWPNVIPNPIWLQHESQEPGPAHRSNASNARLTELMLGSSTRGLGRNREKQATCQPQTTWIYMPSQLSDWRLCHSRRPHIVRTSLIHQLTNRLSR